MFVALAGHPKAIVAYRVGKRNGNNTRAFLKDVRARVLGAPELSSDPSAPTLARLRRGRPLPLRLKRAHKGTFHKLSPKHLDRYVQEFAGRHNLRERDTIDIMGAFASGMGGKRLRYQELIAPNGLPSGARS